MWMPRFPKATERLWQGQGAWTHPALHRSLWGGSRMQGPPKTAVKLRVGLGEQRSERQVRCLQRRGPQRTSRRAVVGARERESGWKRH